jgi:hypothetical protein
MGVLMQFVGTAERSVIRDMDVKFTDIKSDQVKVKVYDAATGNPLNGSTISLSYPGGTKVYTTGNNTNHHTFKGLPSDTVFNVRVTHEGYIPWEGQVATR